MSPRYDVGNMADFEARARTAWPAVTVSSSAFRDFVRERLEDEPSDEIAQDLLLCCGCLEGDDAALRGFDENLGQWVPAFVAKLGLDAVQIDEVRQRLRHRLLIPNDAGHRKLADYRGLGRLPSWLRVVAIRIALDLKQTEARRASTPPRDDQLVSDDPELDYLRQRYAEDFRAAFVDALRGLPLEQRNVLRLHLLDGLNIDRIGQLHDVHRATAARWLASARESLAKETQRLLQARLQVSRSEFESLLRLVRSDLDVSLCRILAEDDD